MKRRKKVFASLKNQCRWMIGIAERGMVSMKLLFCVIAGVLLSLAPVGAGAAESPEFIISYWGGPPAAESTVNRYREIADCGFNLAMPPADGADQKTNLRILDVCKEVGLKFVVQDYRLQLTAKSPDLEKTLDAIVADYSSHPALAGYFVTDEPNAKLFPVLGTINRYLLEKDPKRLPFVNLFPNYANKAQLGNETYEEHVSQFIATVKPGLVSWDHYLQMAGNESRYFKNLDLIRAQCRTAKLPFMQIILSLPHWNYRDPSEADLRWQVYTSLAYGARGIAYFTYWTLPAWKLGDGPAIIGPDGKRDAKYELVRRLNGRLKALGPTLMQIESTGVYATDPLPPGTRRLSPEAPVKKAEGGPMLIGCFKGSKDERYVLAVNRSFKEKIAAELTLDGNVASASEISQESGKPLEYEALEEKPLVVLLEAGEGRLFLLGR